MAARSKTRQTKAADDTTTTTTDTPTPDHQEAAPKAVSSNPGELSTGVREKSVVDLGNGMKREDS